MWVHVCTHVCIVMYITCTMHTMYSTSIYIFLFVVVVVGTYCCGYAYPCYKLVPLKHSYICTYRRNIYIYRRYEGTCVHEVYILIYMDTPIYNVYYVPYALALYEFFAVNLIITVFTLVYASNPY